MKKWETSEDFEKDLFEYSQMEYPGKIFESAPPKSIAEYRARTSKNVGLFDEKMESKEIFISGRGKHTPGVIIRPGMPVTSTPEEDMDIRRKIREVKNKCIRKSSETYDMNKIVHLVLPHEYTHYYSYIDLISNSNTSTMSNNINNYSS